MGQVGSKQLLVQMLKTMLRARGMRASDKQLHSFLAFVEKVCPWFPVEGTVNLETWRRVGAQLQAYYTAHGPTKVPVETFGLWGLVRDCLDPGHETTKMSEQVQPTAPPLEEEAETKEEPLDPGDVAELEDEAPRYHHDDDWDGIMFSTEEKGDEGKVEAALPLDKGGWVEAKLVELEDMIKQLHVGVRPPLTDEGIVPPVQRGPRPTPTPSIIAGLDPPPPPPPVESLFSPQPPTPTWKREKEKHWLPPLCRGR